MGGSTCRLSFTILFLCRLPENLSFKILKMQINNWHLLCCLRSFLCYFKTWQSPFQKKNALFTLFKYLFSFQRFSSFSNIHISKVMMSHTQPNCDQIWRKISQAIWVRNASFFLLNVFHNTSLTILLPWQHTGSQFSRILKAFLATFGVPFWYILWWYICMIQQVYKYVSSSSWPHLLRKVYWLNLELM